MDEHLNLFVQNTPNLFVQRLPPLHCSITKKGKLYERTMNYCKRKLGNNDCDDMEGSIIFQSGSIYLQWMCNQTQGHNIQKYFRVISRKDDDSIDIGTITDRYGATFRSDTMDNVTDIPFKHDAMLFTDLCIKLIIGVAAFLGTVIVFLLVV
ncbi:uncharacterized protein LOC143046569 [Mytilus galloprovincialis]|uniref:uncharacterized protein LOC143046569 n=1 Tax=Mytilus galloprovincialis TaxID=29158 RepID=UPI003F7CC9C3